MCCLFPGSAWSCLSGRWFWFECVSEFSRDCKSLRGLPENLPSWPHVILTHAEPCIGKRDSATSCMHVSWARTMQFLDVLALSPRFSMLYDILLVCFRAVSQKQRSFRKLSSTALHCPQGQLSRHRRIQSHRQTLSKLYAVLPTMNNRPSIHGGNIRYMPASACLFPRGSVQRRNTKRNVETPATVKQLIQALEHLSGCCSHGPTWVCIPQAETSLCSASKDLPICLDFDTGALLFSHFEDGWILAKLDRVEIADISR